MLKLKNKRWAQKNLSETFLVGAPCNLISLCIFQLIHINFFILINPFPLPLPLQSFLGFFQSHLEASESIFVFKNLFFLVAYLSIFSLHLLVLSPIYPFYIFIYPLFIHPLHYIHLSINIPLHLSMYLFIHSIYLFIHSIYLLILSIYLSLHLSIQPTIHLSIGSLCYSKNLPFSKE